MPFSIRIFIPDFKNGGGERLAQRLIAELLKNPKDVSNIEVCAEQRPQGVDCQTTLIGNWRFGFIRKYLTRTDQVDLIYLTGPIMLYGMVGTKGAFLYEHGNPFQLVSLETSPVRKWLYRRALKKCNTIFVVNDSVKTKFVDFFKLPIEKVVVIENPVSKITEHQTFRFIDKDEPVKLESAVIIGRHSPEKRIEDGIDWINRNLPDIRIVVISDMSNTDVPNNVDVYQDYAECPEIDITTSALFNFSRVETFSLVIGEWLAAEGIVFSVSCETLNSIWGNYKGFHLVETAASFRDNAGIDTRPHFDPVSDRVYAKNIRQLIHERTYAG